MSGAPWLLTSHGRLDALYTKQSLYDVTENKCYHAEPNHPEPFLNEKRVIGSTSHGWLVFSHFWDEVFWLWNPKSGSRIKLPPLHDWTNFFNAFVMTKAPTEADCHIILTAQRCFRIAYCRIGDSEFKTLNEWIFAIRSLKGRIYAVKLISSKIHLVTIEFVGAEARVMPIFKVKGSLEHDRIQNMYLVEWEEELLLVYKIQLRLEPQSWFSFRVYRVNPAERGCVKLDSIGDRTLFIADSGDSFCCSAAANKTKPNSIYFAGRKRSMCIYDIDSGIPTNLLPSPAIDPYAHYHSWIKQPPSNNLLTTYFHHRHTT